jgi:hypothetical protein
LFSWKTASLLWNNVWIMGCIWLPNLPWWVIMGPTEHFTTILLPKPSQNLPCVPPCEECTSDCRLSWVFLNRKLFPMGVGNSVKEDSSARITRAFPVVWRPGFMVVEPSFTHLSIIFGNQRFRNCSPTVDAGFLKLRSDSFWGNRVFKMNIQFCCSLLLLQ